MARFQSKGSLVNTKLNTKSALKDEKRGMSPTLSLSNASLGLRVRLFRACVTKRGWQSPPTAVRMGEATHALSHDRCLFLPIRAHSSSHERISVVNSEDAHETSRIVPSLHLSPTTEVHRAEEWRWGRRCSGLESRRTGQPSHHAYTHTH